MSIVLELLKRFWPALALIAVLVGGYSSGYQHGADSTNATWQSKWDAHALADSEATRVAEAAERTKEQARQAAMNKVIQDGTSIGFRLSLLNLIIMNWTYVTGRECST